MPHSIEHNRIVHMSECRGQMVCFVSYQTKQRIRVPLKLLELVLEGELNVDDVPDKDLVFRTLLSHWLDSVGFLEKDFE